jgi:hypothetical protein
MPEPTPVRLRVAHSQLSLAAIGAGAANGTQVQQVVYAGHRDQHWRVDIGPDGLGTLTCVHSGRRIDRGTAVAKNGQRVHLWDPLDVPQQRWKFEPTGPRQYRILTPDGRFALDESTVSSKPEGIIHLWSRHDGLNQVWNFDPIEVHAFEVRRRRPDAPILAKVVWHSQEPELVWSGPDDRETLAQLQRYLLLTSMTTPLIYRHESKEDKSRLITTPFSWSDPAHRHLAAMRLTFSQRNQQGFIFQPARVTLLEGERARPVIPPWLVVDSLLRLPKVSRSPDVRCRCGAAYLAGKQRCHRCNGDDPLARLLSIKSYHAYIDNIIATALKSPDTGKEAEVFLQALREFKDHSRTVPQISGSVTSADVIKVLMPHFDRTLRLEHIRGPGMAAMVNEGQHAARQIIRGAAIAAVRIRQLWWPTTRFGIVPSPTATRKLLAECVERDPGIKQQTKAAIGFIATAAALYKPMRKKMDAILHPSVGARVWWWTKLAMTTASAIASFGTSLILKAGVLIFKEVRDQKRYDRFVEALGKGATAVDELFKHQQQRRTAICNATKASQRAIRAHLHAVLIHDYCALDPDGQDALVARAARSAAIDLGPMKFRGLAEAGPKCIYKASAKNAAPITPASRRYLVWVLAAILAAVLIGIIWHYL